LSVLKEDIQTAKENEFGRKIFDTFAGEFMTSQLSEGTEVAKITKKLDKSATKIAKLEETITEKEEAITSAETAQRVLEDRMDRQKVMEGLLSPLGKEKRSVMIDLLETVKTTNLKTAFKKYLPAVLNEGVSSEAKQSLNEGKVTEHTGDRDEQITVSSTESESSDANIIQLKKLAGIK